MLWQLLLICCHTVVTMSLDYSTLDSSDDVAGTPQMNSVFRGLLIVRLFLHLPFSVLFCQKVTVKLSGIILLYIYLEFTYDVSFVSFSYSFGLCSRMKLRCWSSPLLLRPTFFFWLLVVSFYFGQAHLWNCFSIAWLDLSFT